MRKWPLLVVLGSYVVGLVVFAPATVMDAYLQRASEGGVRLAQADGTVWSGSGELEVRDTGLGAGAGTTVHWRLLPASWARGHVAWQVRTRLVE